jgi:hypothetical protein
MPGAVIEAAALSLAYILLVLAVYHPGQWHTEPPWKRPCTSWNVDDDDDDLLMAVTCCELTTFHKRFFRT